MAAAGRGGRLCSKGLFQVLTTPSKIANALDWKQPVGGSIATLSVQTDRIQLFISSHPSTLPTTTTTTNGDTPVPTTSVSSSSTSSSSSSSSEYSFPLRHQGRRHISSAMRHQLSEIVLDHRVCGFIVCWPLHADTGRMGAACGRTLFAIEQLLLQPQQQYPLQEESPPVSSPLSSIFTQNRKLCFWDATSYKDAEPVDDDATPPPRTGNPDTSHQRQRRRAQPTFDLFGRSAVYAQTSQTQTSQNEAASTGPHVWNEFVHTCWPQLMVATTETVVETVPSELQRQRHESVVQHNTTTTMLEPPQQQQQQQQRRSRNRIIS